MLRRANSLLNDRIDHLRNSIRQVKATWPFRIDAKVVLPGHWYAIWTLPPGDKSLGLRLGQIKLRFSRVIPTGEFLRESRVWRGERGIWQRRFWKHQIRDEVDLAAHIDYIHYKPVKHGCVAGVRYWQYSTFHRYVAKGWYGIDWGSSPNEDQVYSGEQGL